MKIISDMISKAKFNRLQALQAVAGTDATNTTLDFTDQIRSLAPYLADWISDALVFDWLAAGFLNNRLVSELERHDLFHMIGWYYVARWTENDQIRFSAENEKAIHQLAALKIRPTSQDGLEYTGLMLAIYYYRRDVSSVLQINGSYFGDDLLYWYYIHGIQEYRLQRCVTSVEIEALNRPLPAYRSGLISILDLWALARGGVADRVDLSSVPGQSAAHQWATDIRQSESIFEIFQRGSTSAPPPTSSERQRLTRDFPWLGRKIARSEPARTQVTLGHAEYFGRGLRGSRLLLPGEWHDVDECFVWSKYPASSLLFLPDIDPNGPNATDTRAVRIIGLSIHPYAGASMLGQIVSVFLNGRLVADVPVSDMLAGETALIKNVADSVVPDAANLLQLVTSRPLIPSEHLNSHDTRWLGVAFRRIWFG